MVKEKAKFVTKSYGGEGAYREFIDWILIESGKYNQCLEELKVKMMNAS